jgi:small subunit ribosomal protein S18
MGFKKMRPRKKVCFFTKNHIKSVDYKDIELLQRFINPDGKITPRSITGTCAKSQRQLAKAVKNARFMGLLPEAGQK